jgi:hypothetical protein
VKPLWFVLIPVLVGFRETDASRPSSTKSSTLFVLVSDAGTHAFLPGVQVRLPQLGLLRRTTWDGQAIFNGLSEGTYKVEVRALGFAPSDVDLIVKGDTAGVFFELERVATRLDTVRILAPEIPARLREYETRRKMGLGRFLVDSVLASEKDHELAIVLATRFPSLALSAPDVSSPTHHRLVSRRAAGALPHGGGFRLSCGVDVYLDGTLFRDDIDILHPSDLIGVEFYQMEVAPPQYRRGTGSCEVLLLWTRY